MIGGIDVRLPTRASIEAVEVATRAIRQLWPCAVFEQGDTGERYDDFAQVPFGELRELFVYRDPTVAAVWNDQGAVPDVANTMIHLLYDEGWLTAVIDERDAGMEVMIAAIRSALSDPILRVPRRVSEAA